MSKAFLRASDEEMLLVLGALKNPLAKTSQTEMAGSSVCKSICGACDCLCACSCEGEGGICSCDCGYFIDWAGKTLLRTNTLLEYLA